MPVAGFEPAIPVGDRPQTHTLDRSATGIGTALFFSLKYLLQGTFRKQTLVSLSVAEIMWTKNLMWFRMLHLAETAVRYYMAVSLELRKGLLRSQFSYLTSGLFLSGKHPMRKNLWVTQQQSAKKNKK